MNSNFLKQKKILNSGIYINFSDIKLNENFLNQLRCAAPRFVRKLTDIRKINDINHISIDLVQEDQALYENKITLSKKLDPLNVPLIEIHANKSEKLKNSAAEIMNEFANFLLDNDIGRVAINEYVFSKNDYDLRDAGGHHMGTTRIGESIKDSVVDKNLKVHGFKNLFISGSSIFRTGGHCHPTHTIVQFALRLSDHLSKLVI
jgi:choline dehydrogenase-like flavoprotein